MCEVCVSESLCVCARARAFVCVQLVFMHKYIYNVYPDSLYINYTLS